MSDTVSGKDSSRTYPSRSQFLWSLTRFSDVFYLEVLPHRDAGHCSEGVP